MALDLIIPLWCVGLILVIGMLLSRGIIKQNEGYFLSGRTLPWWLTGMSLAMGTFTLQHALLIAGSVSQRGISINLAWQSMAFGSLFMTFFFSRLWRRLEVKTDLEILEVRYTGQPARYLRLAKSLYIGFFMVVVLVGWSNILLLKFLSVFFTQPQAVAIFFVVSIITLIYVASQGQPGTVFLGALLFAMVAIVSVMAIIAMLNEPIILINGGIQKTLPEWMLMLLPKVTSISKDTTSGVYEINNITFNFLIAVQWWSSWSLGVENANSSMAAQRSLSAKSEKHILWGMLFFVLIYYTLLPLLWTTIGLFSASLYPQVNFGSESFLLAMSTHNQLIKMAAIFCVLGIYVASVSAYLNLGTSYLFNDFILTLRKKIRKDENATLSIRVEPLLAVILGTAGIVVSIYLEMGLEACIKYFEVCGAGMGFVLIMRWFWWRVNIWAEWGAFIVPSVTAGICYLIGMSVQEMVFVSTAVTIAISFVLIYYTQPESREVLDAFYKKANIGGGFWKRISSPDEDDMEKQGYGFWFLDWMLSSIMVYSAIFAFSRMMLAQYLSTIVLSLVSVTASMLLFIDFERRGWVKSRKKIGSR